jgi:hypothetical protein
MYRGVGLGDAAADPDGGGGREMLLVSASFSRRVAENHFGSVDAAAGALYRQRLQPGRLFMTFLETGAMARQYREAEAVLLPGQRPVLLTAAPPAAAAGRRRAVHRCICRRPRPS